ncbi:glycosyltransferase family 2 protein [Kaistia terrae]|uniref:Glycosyltransferase family 2 protein n=1 Tax=Kaistia terrae TaxID=537017 RepID=A0ABW0PTD2_9HYPH|nr:glycosyltransferase family 2 protein [Kaistia terrae]MCX5577646.1 glycosyltransferase family 2 protein [Kaistia terrae]
MGSVSIVIPTLNRPRALRRAVESALAQTDLADLDIEILVIDNSSDGNARDLVEAIAPGANRPVRYVSAPVPGVANARNAGVNAAQGRWVAFLDDDEQACETWLSRHVETARHSGADAVFGPVTARAEDGRTIGPLAPYFSRQFDRIDGEDVTDLAPYLGTNNSMFDRVRCLQGEGGPFDTSLNETGGEDTLLLKRLAEGGKRFTWSAQASVTEWVPERRMSWAYVRKRKFLSGQIRVMVHHKLHPAQWSRIAFWMCVGMAQIVLYGIAAIALRPFSRLRAQKASVKVFGGLGKVLWMPRFRPALYGSGLVS